MNNIIRIEVHIIDNEDFYEEEFNFFKNPETGLFEGELIDEPMSYDDIMSYYEDDLIYTFSH